MNDVHHIALLVEKRLRGETLSKEETALVEGKSRRMLDIREVMSEESQRFGECAESVDGWDDFGSVYGDPER